MTHGARRAAPLLLAVALAPLLTLMACASAPPAGPAAQTSPQPALAASAATVPGAAKQVTLSLKYGANAHGRKPPAPVTITAPAQVSAAAGLVAHQPPFPPGTYNCPPGDGMALDLTFRAQPGGPALATAVVALNGCEATNLTVNARDYVLGHPDSARVLAARVLKAAGVAWNLPPAYWPA